MIGSNPAFRYWRGGSDKGTWSCNVAGGDGAWLNFRWPGVGEEESCARTWRLGANDESGLNTQQDGVATVENLSTDRYTMNNYSLNAPFVLIKYNTPRASGRGDGNQTTCDTFGDKPIKGNSTFGEMLFVQRLYKRQVKSVVERFVKMMMVLGRSKIRVDFRRLLVR